MSEDFRAVIGEFDHNAPELRDAVPEIFPFLHACPVHSSRNGGYDVFTCRADVSELARDHTRFSSANLPGAGSGGGILIPPSPVRIGFLEMDPPEHLPLRRAVAKWFAPGAVGRYEGRMRELIRGRVAYVSALGQFDVIDDLANPVTAMLTLDFLGMPIEDWPVYLKPVHDQAYVNPSSPEFAELLQGIADAQGALAELIVERRQRPADDLISDLLALSDDQGEGLPDATIIDVMWGILGGGFDTTSSAIGHILHYLSEHSDRREELLEHDELLPTAIDEFVRYFAPATFSARTVTEQTVVDDVTLQPGARVLVGWAAANFDADAFDDPFELRFDRSPNRHLSYGDGIHRCPGARFAQLELTVLLDEVFRQMPDLEVHGDRVVPIPTAAVINGFIHMPASARGAQASAPL